MHVEVTTTPARAEVKVPLPSALLGDVRAWTRLHPAHWRRTYPARQINNLYFDTANYAGLNANLAGVADRAKLRMRWYGPCLARPGNPQLELKRKQGLAGWKEIVHVGRDFDLEIGAWSILLDDLWAAVGNRAPNWLMRFPLPVLINAYQREYFATPDGAVRLTIDTDLRALDQRSSAQPNVRRETLLADIVVVEIKAGLDDEATERLAAIISGLPARVDRFSKYVRGVMAAPDL
jgi:hypothetical protein